VKTRIGIDVGGVLMARGEGTQDTIFADAYLTSPQCPMAFEWVKVFVDRFGSQNVFIVSKCGNKIRARTLEWLEHNKFYEITGFDRGNVRFCYQRHEKAGICRDLQITHFIDDRAEVLSYMNTVPHLYRLGEDGDDGCVESRYGKDDYQTLCRIESYRAWTDIALAIAKSSRPTWHEGSSG
jgi:hypothetical protein